jgi:hypothetical protein
MTALLSTLPEFKFEVSWTTNPYDTPVWVDLTTDLMSFTTHRGRQHDLNRMEAGTASVTLNNASGDYWPDKFAYAPLDLQVAASTDNCQVYRSGAAWYLSGFDSTYFATGYYDADQYRIGGGYRFTGITLPSDAFIDRAYLSIHAHLNYGFNTVNTYITGNKENNPATFSTLADYQARRGTVVGGADDTKITTAHVAWDAIPAWTGEKWYNSPNISAIIQELVDAHAPTNEAMVIFWDDHDDRSTHTYPTVRESDSYTHDSAEAAKLQIEYHRGHGAGNRDIHKKARITAMYAPAADDSGVTSPTVMADDATVGTLTWDTPNNAKAFDSAYTQILTTAGTSHYLKASHFNFAIPAKARIDGIVVEFNKFGNTGANNTKDSEVKIIKSSGTIGAVNRADTVTAWPNSNTYVAHGSSSDLWGESWSPADINSDNFGVVLSATLATEFSAAYIDHIRITVYYTTTLEHLFTGYIESFTPSWLSNNGGLGSVMQLNLVDAQAGFSRNLLNNAGYAQELSGTRITNVLDDVSFPAADRTIDTGIYGIQASGAIENVNALDHISSVYDSEIGLFYIDAAGNAVFEDRSHRASATSSATFTNTMAAIDLSLDDTLLINQVRATIVGGVEQVEDDAVSQTLYGLYVLAKSGLLFTLDGYSTEYASLMLARYAYPALRAKSMMIRPQGDPATLYPFVLGFDISTRITVELTGTTISADYFIEAIDHACDARTGMFTTTWMLSDAARYMHNAAVVDLILRPNGAGDTTELVPSTGANWECVNETPANDTDVVASTHTTVYKEDLYALPNLTAASTINSVTIHYRVAGNGDGYEYDFKPAIKTTGGEFYGTEHQYLTGTVTGWTNYTDVWTVNPLTSAAFTGAEINAMQAGIAMIRVRVDGTGAYVWCSQLYITVNVTPQW